MIFDVENWLWKSNFGTFDTSPLHQFSKSNNSLLICWFLGKNVSNFVSPAWKLDNPYYHSNHIRTGELGIHQRGLTWFLVAITYFSKVGKLDNPYCHILRSTCFCTFLRRIKDTKKSFQNNWPLYIYICIKAKLFWEAMFFVIIFTYLR